MIVINSLFCRFSIIPTNISRPSTPDGQILINIKLSDDFFGAPGETFDLYSLEDALEEAMSDAATLDGHEIGGGYFACRFDATNIKAALNRVWPLLTSHQFRPNSFMLIIYSDKQTQQIDLPLADGLFLP